jgi:hypothetical protein
MGELNDISNEVYCDKSWYHKYMDTYEIFLKEFKERNIKLFEIGVERGLSYKVWEQYFTRAEIYGLDLNIEYVTNRGKVFKGDQSDINVIREICDNLIKCDIIIDDGSHVPEHQIMCFEYLFQNLLSHGGVYIIEDIECSYWRKDCSIYGYKFSGLNIIDYFTKYLHMLNSHYNNHDNLLNIKNVIFLPNSIIIIKNDENVDDREYRFKDYL